MQTRTIAILVAALVTTGCATRIADNQTRIVVSSNPPGATLKFKTASGYVTRPSPLPIVWTHPKGTYIDTAFVVATWPSGATTTTRLNLYAGQDSTALVQRPDYPGLERDNQYAAEAASAAANAKAEGVVFLLNTATVAMDVYTKSKQAQVRSHVAQSQQPVSRPTSTQAPSAPPGFQTRDAFGNSVNSRDSFQAKDSQGNLVNSRDNYQTRDNLGNLVNSRDSYQTTDSLGNIVRSTD